MAGERGTEALEGLLKVLEVESEVTGLLVERVTALEERCGELSEDVAGLSLRVALHSPDGDAGHSLRVFTTTAEQRLEQVTHELRAELAAEVAAITERIDEIHTRALRALTDQIERNRS